MAMTLRPMALSDGDCSFHPRAIRRAYNDPYVAVLQRGDTMGCLKGKSEAKPKKGNYACTKCGAVTKKKKHVCKPQKIKDD